MNKEIIFSLIEHQVLTSKHIVDIFQADCDEEDEKMLYLAEYQKLNPKMINYLISWNINVEENGDMVLIDTLLDKHKIDVEGISLILENRLYWYRYGVYRFPFENQKLTPKQIKYLLNEMKDVIERNREDDGDFAEYMIREIYDRYANTTMKKDIERYCKENDIEL